MTAEIFAITKDEAASLVDSILDAEAVDNCIRRGISHIHVDATVPYETTLSLDIDEKGFKKMLIFYLTRTQ